jgi:hypothetical protein
VNTAQLQEFAQRPAVLGATAVGVVGLALLHRKKAAAAPGGAKQPAGTIPAAAVVPAQGYAGPDNSAVQVYDALSSQLEQMRQTSASGSGVTAAPAPVASTLFAPTGSGKFVRYADGNVFEVESDGSLFGLTPNQNDQATRAAGPGISWEQLQSTMPIKYSTAANLAKVNG